MRLIVLDTNVVISAGIGREGAPARLMMDWVLDGRVQAVTCPYIVNEYRAVVRRKKFARYGFPPLWLEFLISESLFFADPEPWALPLPDPKDAPFLSTASITGAWLVSGNLKHYPARARAGVTAISPADYLASLDR